MKQFERYCVIDAYLKRPGQFMVNVIDSEFVDHYIKETGASFEPMIIGAHRCKTLASDLRAMYNIGTLDRCVMGLPGAGPGFPKWVYCYALPGKLK